LGALIAPAQQAPADASAQKKAPAKPAAAQPARNTMDPGERAFQANCTRCHNAPEQLSRRISGTVLMHMRVRASLSAQDQRDILHFFAP
jgi:cytochrome c5